MNFLGVKESNLGTLVTCLKIARSSGLMDFYKTDQENASFGHGSLWCGVVPEQLMRKALFHLDDQVCCDHERCNLTDWVQLIYGHSYCQGKS